MSGSLRTCLSLLRLALILFIVSLFFTFSLIYRVCPHPPPEDHTISLGGSVQNLHPTGDLCRDLHSSLRAWKSIFLIDHQRTSTRPPASIEHRPSTDYPDTDTDTASRTIEALSDLTSCYAEHGTEDFTRVTLRGRRARCSRSIIRLFDLAATPEGYVALHHHVDKEELSDRSFELEDCYDTLGSLSQGNKDICLRRFFKDPKLLPTTECIDRWEFKLAVLHHLASCDLRSSELQSCAARQILHVIEDFPGCQVGPDHVVPASTRELRKREDVVEVQPLLTFAGKRIRRFHPTKFIARLSGCLDKKARGLKPNAVRKEGDEGDDDDGDDDDEDDPQRCEEVEKREKLVTMVLVIIFVVLSLIASVGIVLQTWKNKSKSNAHDDESWASHRSSIQDVNRNVRIFTDTSIPEESEGNDEDDTARMTEKSKHWYDRIFKKGNGKENQRQQSKDERMKLKRRTPPEDVENVFVMPPAPNSRVKKKKYSFTRIPLGPISDNTAAHEDATGHRVSSTGSAHAPPPAENGGVRKSSRTSSERSQKRLRL
ncbi:MAG: hypothetical protein M1816_005303 [Peltula sp. TS41687]|nr:MAG: hypothetical protein M1816_005303 [Peltula sp. TS41687]